ncbi:proline racemase family protein [Streptomyces malaysiensis subsp. malaysiensis]
MCHQLRRRPLRPGPRRGVRTRGRRRFPARTDRPQPRDQDLAQPDLLRRTPLDSPLSGIYGVIFFEEQGRDAHGNPRQRNVTVFADGEVDRSPCGSGTCARVATLHSTGRLRQGEILLHSSIVGSEWQARVTDTLQVAGRDAVLPVVTGRAFRTGEHRFVVNPDDDMVPGFVLR